MWVNECGCVGERWVGERELIIRVRMCCVSVYVESAHLVQQGVSRPLLLHTQVTNPRHELVRVQEEA